MGMLTYHYANPKTRTSTRFSALSFDSQVVRRSLQQDVKPSDRFFIDAVMSPDGEILSKGSRHLEKKKWGGLCVFPFPTAKEKKGRSCQVVNNALGANSGATVLVPNCKGRWPKLKAYISSWLSNGPYACPQVEAQTISTFDLLTTYKAPRVIDYMALDVRGEEVEILKTFPSSQFCVRSWSVTHWGHKTEIKELLSNLNCHTRLAGDAVFARCPCHARHENRPRASDTTHYAIPAKGLDSANAESSNHEVTTIKLKEEETVRV